MARAVKILFLILFYLPAFSQESKTNFADPDYYLVDSLILEELGDYDRNLIDSALNLYHYANSDSLKINALVILSEEVYDPIWFKYNEYLKKECEQILKSNPPEALKKLSQSRLAGTINNYGYFFSNKGQPDLAMKYYKQSLRLLIEIGDREASAQSLSNIGFQFSEIGLVDSALAYYHKALEIERDYRDFSGMGVAFNNIASIHMDRSEINAAFAYYDSAMKAYEKIDDKPGVALIMNNMAINYLEQGEDSMALVYMMRSMETAEELGDQRGLAGVLNNMGTIFNKPETRDEAMDYFQRGLELYTELGDIAGMATSYSHIGALYYDLGDIKKAKEYHEKAYEIRKQTQEKVGISFSLASLSRIYLDLGLYQRALEAGTQSLKMSQELGFPEIIETSAFVLHKVYHEMENWEQSLEMHQLYIHMRDSVSNQATRREALRRHLKHEFEKREAIKSAENAKQIEIVEEREEKQKLISLFIGLSLIIVILFAVFVYNRLKESQKQKRIIEKQKQQVEEAHQELEVKNKEVIDSILYAKRIQQALLKSEKHETRHLPEHFILFLPKDIVSGDFYWAMEKEGKLYFAAADCTGHGVPGAFLTMLGTSFLNEINAKDEIFTPSVLLDKLREKIIKELSQSGEHDATKDGMDISMIRLDLKTRKMDWAGANNPLYHIRNGKMSVIKPDKQPIGYHEYMTPFKNHELQLEKGDLLYLFTDGYADQFGGPKGKKFMYKNFKEKILSVSALPLENQKEELLSTFSNWKGDEPQLDDVCVIGIMA